jgi:hypothetical protein
MNFTRPVWLHGRWQPSRSSRWVVPSSTRSGICPQGPDLILIFEKNLRILKIFFLHLAPLWRLAGGSEHFIELSLKIRPQLIS